MFLLGNKQLKCLYHPINELTWWLIFQKEEDLRKSVDVVKNPQEGYSRLCLDQAKKKKRHLQLGEQQERKRRKRETSLPSLLIFIRYIKDFEVWESRNRVFRAKKVQQPWNSPVVDALMKISWRRQKQEMTESITVTSVEGMWLATCRIGPWGHQWLNLSCILKVPPTGLLHKLHMSARQRSSKWLQHFG